MGQKHKADTKRPRRAPRGDRVAPPAIPPALAALAADADATAMRARINVAGAQPTPRDGWLLVWEAICQACTPKVRLHITCALSPAACAIARA